MSSARPRIGFIVDHPKRDLGGGAMLAHALAQRGIETALIPLYDQGIDVPLLGLDGLVVNFARPVNLDLVRGYHDAGLPVWVLDTEGGILADNGANTPSRLAAYVRDSGFAPLLAGYFFWGSELHEAFRRDSGMSDEKLHLTGCPRFDFAAPAWRDLLRHERDGYVLINANFTLVNSLFSRSPEAEMANLIAAGWEREYVERLIAEHRGILVDFIETVRRLATQLPARKFLLRPHPFENAERYSSALSSLPNVTIDARGSVLNVIHHAECVLHLNCGTAIEAVMLEKLPLSLEFLNREHTSRHSSLPSRVSLPVRREEQLVELLSDLGSVRPGFDFEVQHREFVQPWFHLNDGKAAARVASVLAAAVHGKAAAKASLRRSLMASRLKPRMAQRLQAALANGVGSRAASRLRALVQPLRRAKQLDVAPIRELSDAIARHAGMPAVEVGAARHPITGARLASILVAHGAA
jgi:surface carbohydrate biosynthesis protein